MDATSPRSCPETGTGNMGVENSSSATVMLQLRGKFGERVTLQPTHQVTSSEIPTQNCNTVKLSLCHEDVWGNEKHSSKHS
jgi:hypothetical protein